MDYLKEECFELFSQLNHDCRNHVFHFVKGLLLGTEIHTNKQKHIQQEGDKKTNGKI